MNNPQPEDILGDEYRTEYEWPQDEDLDHDWHSKQPRRTMRLVALRSRILAKGHTIAVVDAYNECQIGRDAAPPGMAMPRIRLKEMEVSKLHATIFWDTGRMEWAIVDMGSMHGTYLLSSAGTRSLPSDASSSSKGIRLSPSRVASMPRRLCHLDLVTIGGTTFCAHIHERDPPCEGCSSSGNADIPLFPMPKKRTVTGVVPSPEEGRSADVDPRKALASLKRDMLSRHRQASSPEHYPDRSYVDRSARRRALYPSSHADAPGTSSPSTIVEQPPVPTRAPSPPSPEPVSAPAVPLPSSNVGHMLLMKQGWEPGTSLGSLNETSPGGHRIEPIGVTTSVGRAGIGMQTLPQSSTPMMDQESWKEHGKHKRWDSLR
jgi:hypothetical protein